MSPKELKVSDDAAHSSTLFDGTAVDHDEHVANVISTRRAFTAGLLVWVAFGLTDVLIAELMDAARLWVLLLLRALGIVFIGLIVIRLRAKRQLTQGALRFIDVITFVMISVLISLACVEFRGIESPLAVGVVTLLTCRTAFLPDRWRRALLPVGLAAIAHPVTLVVAALFLPSLGTQLGDRHALGQFVFNEFFVIGAAGITLLGGHLVWALRRKVYEARSLGRYRLIRRIGRGGMGEVWVAHHNTLRRDVAVKIVRPDKMDSTARERFEREVHATSELSHPNTVRVFDYGVTEDGLCYYAMELLEGEDLGEIVKREGALKPRRAALLVLQAAKAVAEAHAHGIVHRDIKPSNIFVTRVGTDRDLVKVLDFGLARMSRPDAETTLTDTGCVVGTPAYMAPEILTGQPAHPGADVYALGAVLYKVLCGSVPYECDDRRAMIQARLGQDPQPPSEVLGSPLPRELEAIVLRSLHRDPDTRYHSALHLVEALSEWLLSLPPSASEDALESAASITIPERVSALESGVRRHVDSSAPTRSMQAPYPRAEGRPNADQGGAGQPISIHDEETVIEKKVGEGDR